MSKTNVLGEGSYGCVINPPAKCSTTDKNGNPISFPSNYLDNKVSKMLLRSEQDKEIGEYTRLAKIDPNGDYFMPMPIACEAEDKTFSEFNECPKIQQMLTDGITKKEDYALLIIENGGIDLLKLCKFIDNGGFDGSTQERIYDIFNAGVKLFEGIQKCGDAKNGFIHYDIKPPNIVYNESLKKMLIIDFGTGMELNDRFNAMKLAFMKSANFSHFSFPPEMATYNLIYVQKLYDEKTYDYIKTEISKHLKILRGSCYLGKSFNDYAEQSLNLYLHEFRTVFTQSFLEKNTDKKLLDTITDEKLLDTICDNFMFKTIQTFDSYGLGISMLSLYSRLMDVIPENISDSLLELFKGVTDSNPFSRLLPAEIIPRYKLILNEYKQIIDTQNEPYLAESLPKPPPLPTDVKNHIYETPSKVSETEINNLVKSVENMKFRTPPKKHRPTNTQSPTKKRRLSGGKRRKIRGTRRRNRKHLFIGRM